MATAGSRAWAPLTVEDGSALNGEITWGAFDSGGGCSALAVGACIFRNTVAEGTCDLEPLIAKDDSDCTGLSCI